MNCPYCGGTMQDGYLKCSHRLKWGPEKTLAASDEDIVLSKRMFTELFVGTCIDAAYCKNCKKIIMTVE